MRPQTRGHRADGVPDGSKKQRHLAVVERKGRVLAAFEHEEEARDAAVIGDNRAHSVEREHSLHLSPNVPVRTAPPASSLLTKPSKNSPHRPFVPGLRNSAPELSFVSP